MSLKESILKYMQTEAGEFNELALSVFTYQYQQCLPYQHYCQQLNKTPQTIQHWHDIPSVPTDVFREFDLCTFNIKDAKYIFNTSGTTQENKGKHFYRDMSLYDEAIRLSFMKGLGLTTTDKVIFRILTPSFTEISTSSLFYMLDRGVLWYGANESHFYMKNNEMDYAKLATDLAEDIALNRPIVLIGTAFSFVNLFDHSDAQWKLPSGSRLMETGGLKGRSREISKDELYHLFKVRLHLEKEVCYSEYGMTELSSQCYSLPPSYQLAAPHWMKVRIINPETGNDVNVGEIGLVQFFDLANLEAIAAVTTSDMARRLPNSFELTGRAPLSVLRGCSTLFEI